jgi:membrane associated rhomboid family serine protease
MVIPLGLVEAPPTRKPWACFAIAFLSTGVLVLHDMLEVGPPTAEEKAARFTEYWRAHPYLVPPKWLAPGLDQKQVAAAEAEAGRRASDHSLPDTETLAIEGKEWLHTLSSDEDPWALRWGFTPARGWSQPGWVTATFLSSSWFELVLNLIFFLVVGTVLEGGVGAVPLVLLYVAGGAVGRLVQASSDWESQVAMVSSAGAIAACMGAFTVRFWSDHLRVMLWRGLRPDLVEWPTWIWKGLWVVEQVVVSIVWSGNIPGPRAGASRPFDEPKGASMFVAHLAAFALGGGVALVLRQVRPRAPQEKSVRVAVPVVDDALSRAEALADKGNLPGAIQAYNAIVTREPGNVPARWGLVRAMFRAGQDAEASRLFDEVLAQWLARGNRFIVRQAVGLVGHQLDPRALQPARAAAVGAELEHMDRERAIAAYEVAARAGVPGASEKLESLR